MHHPRGGGVVGVFAEFVVQLKAGLRQIGIGGIVGIDRDEGKDAQHGIEGGFAGLHQTAHQLGLRGAQAQRQRKRHHAAAPQRLEQLLSVKEDRHQKHARNAQPRAARKGADQRGGIERQCGIVPPLAFLLDAVANGQRQKGAVAAVGNGVEHGVGTRHAHTVGDKQTRRGKLQAQRLRDIVIKHRLRNAHDRQHHSAHNEKIQAGHQLLARLDEIAQHQNHQHPLKGEQKQTVDLPRTVAQVDQRNEDHGTAVEQQRQRRGKFTLPNAVCQPEAKQHHDQQARRRQQRQPLVQADGELLGQHADERCRQIQIPPFLPQGEKNDGRKQGKCK